MGPALAEVPGQRAKMRESELYSESVAYGRNHPGPAGAKAPH